MMKEFTFKAGGAHPEENKLTKDAPFINLTPPAVVVIPLSQHIGA
ncbi:MAG: hypothetical protein DRI33_00785, partial [Caldiserica bacterium]